MEQIYKLNDNQILYAITLNNLFTMTENWSNNRPPDEDRVNSIFETIIQNKEMGDPIHLAQVEGKNKLQCFDGNHRREAYIRYLLEVENDNLIQNDERKILIYLHKNITEQELKQKFIIVNSGNPVPELYTISTISNLELKKASIENIVEKLCNDKNFKKHKSQSNNPRKPNFNKTTLTNNLLKRLENVEFNEEVVYRKILELNNIYKTNTLFISTLSESVNKKCAKTGCYLFCKNDFTEDLALA
jgi:hypothetical protein